MRQSTKRKFTHLDDVGQANMVDISIKHPTLRNAIAEGWVLCSTELEKAIRANKIVKGNLLEVARLAGIQAAKRTAELIPLCHSLPLDAIKIELKVLRQKIGITAEVQTTWKTGVEMEALTAVAVTALTIIDMGKAIDKGMQIDGVRLLRKTGGKSGVYQATKRKR